MSLSTGMKDRGRELAQRLRASELARQEFLAELSPACPHDGLPGGYVGIIGAPGEAHLAFACPLGDRFAYSAQTGAMWPIPREDWERIDPQPLDRLRAPIKTPIVAPASGNRSRVGEVLIGSLKPHLSDGATAG